MYNKHEENSFCDAYRAMHGGSKVNAMVQYRELKKTNTPYTRKYINTMIEGFEENARRTFYDD